MIQFPANANILVMHDAVSFRNGFDGTAAIARVVLQKEPMMAHFLSSVIKWVTVCEFLSTTAVVTGSPQNVYRKENSTPYGLREMGRMSVQRCLSESFKLFYGVEILVHADFRTCGEKFHNIKL